jgi:hypothetical protein
VIVGLVGSIGSGKGTVADILAEAHNFRKESFANSVKDAASIIFGWSRELLEGDTIQSRSWREEPDDWWSKKMGKPFSPREALQLLGTEAGRNVFHQDLWIYSLQRRINPNKNYVIADVRFPNEIKMITDLGGKVIRVKRGENPAFWDTALDANANGTCQGMAENFPDVHYSEWAWIGNPLISMTIDNNGTLFDLKNRLDVWLNREYNNLHVDGFDPSEVNTL